MRRHLLSFPARAARRLPAAGQALVASVIGLATAACAAPACEPAAVREVAQGLWVREGRPGYIYVDENLANVGFVVGERCVAVIDTGGSPEEGEALRCAIASLTELPVCYVVISHVHPDHMLGNLAFADAETVFVGHHKLPRALAQRGDIYLQRAGEARGEPLDPSHIVLPQRLVRESDTLDLGGRTLRLNAHPSAHTDHDLSVYDERTATLWLADLLFVQHTPVIDSSINGWIAVLEAMSGTPAAHVIPGHGPVDLAWPAAAADNLRYLRLVRGELREWIAAGRDMRGAQDEVGYAESNRWQLFDEYHRRNIATAFLELEWE